MKADAAGFLAAVRKAQAEILTRSHMVTVGVNGGISISAALVMILLHGAAPGIDIWLAASLAALLVRVVAVRLISRHPGARRHPAVLLKTMTAGSLLSGLAWAALPFSVGAFEGTGQDAAIFLIMIGMSAGSALRGIGSATVSLAFSIPVLSSVLVSLLLTGTPIALVLALNVLAFGAIVLRGSLFAEQVFVSNELAKLEATALAESLSDANRDILQTNSRLEVLASYDPVTGLANRTSFNERLVSDLDRSRREGAETALLLLDLDRFKSINDTLGHSAGDAVLKEVAQRLTVAVGRGGMIARIGGDEFAVICQGRDAGTDARAHAAAILDLAQRPFSVGGSIVPVGVSIGLACFPHHAGSAEDLLANADIALYAAKEDGRRCLRAFDPDMKARVDRQRMIEDDLEGAIAGGELDVWFQPQVFLDSKQIAGFEALLRWFHPRLGSVSPPEIVQAAQALHIADRLTAYVAHAVCRLLNELPGLGLPKATVGLNISPREFALYCVAGLLEPIVRQHDIDPSLLEIEITEEAILDAEGAGEQLKRLESAGYKLAVDDFGMGHSSLAYLISLKVDRLKIDRSFVRGVADSRANQELIIALVGLGMALSLEIVVEGVETQEDVQVLQMLGCRVGQGYVFARPMSLEALRSWLGARGRKSLAGPRGTAAVA